MRARFALLHLFFPRPLELLSEIKILRQSSTVRVIAEGLDAAEALHTLDQLMRSRP
jgi:hypothetical protein